MGDPRRQRKKYATPRHPWQKGRIEEEKQLVADYGLKNKKELWKMDSQLKTYALNAKRLTTATCPQAETEKMQLIKKLASLGLIEEAQGMNHVLSVPLKNFLERRLQTLVFKRNLAHSVKQARQFIVHEHIMVGNKTINLPSYIVTKGEEDTIIFNPHSSISSPEHPERITEKKTPGETEK